MMADTFSALAALIFVIALMLALSWGIRRLGILPGQAPLKNGKKQIKVMESKLLDGRNRLVVVRWKNKEYLLATNPNGTKIISKDDTPQTECVEEDETA